MHENRVQAAFDRAARFCLRLFILFVLANVVAAVLAPRLEKTLPIRPVPMPRTTGHDYTNVVPKDDPDGRPVLTRRRDWESLQWVDLRALKGMSQSDIDTLLDEFGDFGHLGYQFEPYVGFAPYPCKGQAINVEGDEPEFVHRRTTLGGLRPPAAGVEPWGRAGSGGLERGIPAPSRKLGAAPRQIYIFGGSTTFGIYVADGQTWPSALGEALRGQAQVTNYGRPYYFSTQEVALLIHLLKTGHHPDAVVFMDGLNDCFMPFWVVAPDAPMFTDKMTEWIQRAQFGRDWLVQDQWIPVVRLAFALHQRLLPQTSPAPDMGTTDDVANRIIDSYRQNIRIVQSICQTYGVKAYFFWQPCPFYHFDLATQRRTFLIPPAMWEVFNKTYDRVQKELPETVFLGNLMEHAPAPALVDNFHYSPAFNKTLGERVAQEISQATQSPAGTGGQK